MQGIRMAKPQNLVFVLVALILWPSQVAGKTNSNEKSTDKPKPALNMAYASLDDQYNGCMANMKSLLPSLLRSELQNSTLYSEAWVKALFNWQDNQTWMYPRNLEELSEVAVYAYTLAFPPLYKEFNSATRTAAKTAQEYVAYPFKSLHFLLTWATRFGGKKFKCQRVYRGTSMKFSIGRYFRFGQFTSTSEDPEVAKYFETVTFFKLITCKGIDISDKSFYHHEEEVLVPPYEMFRVKSIKKTSRNKTVVAISVGSCSNHNCIFVGEGSNHTKSCHNHQVLYL